MVEALNNLQDGVQGITSDVGGFIKENPLATAVGAGVVGAGVGVGVAALVGSSSKKTTRKKSRKSNKRKTKKKKSKQKKPYTAGKNRDRSRKRIRYTKNNQPYILLRSGKARFIKKSSVSRRRKLKGGTY